MAQKDKIPQNEKPASQAFIEATQQILTHAETVLGTRAIASHQIEYNRAQTQVTLEKEDGITKISVALGGFLLQIKLCPNESTIIQFRGKTFFISNHAEEMNAEAQSFVEKYLEPIQIIGAKYQKIAKEKLRAQRQTISEETQFAAANIMGSGFDGTSVGIPTGQGANARVAEAQINAVLA